jgi:hypothetical protein
MLEVELWLYKERKREDVERGKRNAQTRMPELQECWTIGIEIEEKKVIGKHHRAKERPIYLSITFCFPCRFRILVP